ncbi:MAG TPA: hypothetical protein VI541_03385 [Actinomycetota bacterium]|nr:hypothetical protein [Actinomycetota bacterium]
MVRILVLAALLLLASWWGQTALTIAVAIVAVGAGLVMMKAGANRGSVGPLVVGVLAASYPTTASLLHYSTGPGSSRLPGHLLLLSAGSLVVLTTIQVLHRQREAVVRLVSSGFFFVMYAGLPATFVIMIRAGAHGTRLLVTFVVILAAYLLGSRVAGKLLRSTSLRDRPPVVTWPVGLIGTLVASLGGFAVGAARVVPVSSTSLLVIGALVGITAVLGEVAATMMHNESSTSRSDSLLHIAVFSAPAFYYALALYLV